ncbi:hypothetical protein [Methanobrevibacter sp.]|nr:hypothetical protein [Methanobrevibacter sp.]
MNIPGKHTAKANAMALYNPYFKAAQKKPHDTKNDDTNKNKINP